MKKFLTILLIVICLVPFCVFAKEKKEDKRVKVYVFEAGGCPYCDAEKDYLKGLKSYNKKFVIVSKELYVDHVDWKQGKDYDLGVSVANEFNKAGYKDAAYNSTPFVVISDTFAGNGYNTDLEGIIDAAYEEGDKDAVSCISKGKDDCVRLNEKAIEEEEKKEKSNEVHGGVAVLVLGSLALAGVIVYIILKGNKNTLDEEDDDFEEEEESEEEDSEEEEESEDDEESEDEEESEDDEESDDEEEKEEIKPAPKKQPVKKQPVKKQSTSKKQTKKTNSKSKRK